MRNEAIGDTPHYLMYGQDPFLPYNTFMKPEAPVYNVEDYITFITNSQRKAFRATESFLQRAQEKYVAEYNKRVKAKTQEVKLGDRCYVKRMQPKKHKLETPFLGPFRVIDLKNDAVTVKDIVSGKQYVVHRSIVKIVREKDAEASINPNVRAVFPVHCVKSDEEIREQLEE